MWIANRCGVGRLVLIASMISAVSCGGGGGGGGGGGNPEPAGEIVLTNVFLARGLETASGIQAVSPLTTVRRDFLTGLDDSQTLSSLFNSDPQELVSFGIDADYSPIVAPRNGTIVLEFSKNVDPSSVVEDVIDQNGQLVSQGSVFVRDEEGCPIAIRLRSRNRRIFITPMGGEGAGFPASPVELDSSGQVKVPERGHLFLTIPVTQGEFQVGGENGEELVGREDVFGVEGKPIEFIPGNAELDFIEQNELGPVQRLYNGSLPDIHPPRLVREFQEDGILGISDSVAVDNVFLADASFDTNAKGGLGEWAGAFLILRPGESEEETLLIERNEDRRLFLEDQIIQLPSVGERWRLFRWEVFEPDLDNVVDSQEFDPNNPENENNQNLSLFVSFIEVDDQGNETDVNGDGRTKYRAEDTLPARFAIRCQFSEIMDPDSFQPYESMRVAGVTEGSSSSYERLGAIDIGMEGRVFDFVPRRVNSSNPDDTEVVGFGSDAGNHAFILQTTYDTFTLRNQLNPQQFAEYIALGHLLVSDLSGTPLAISPAAFNDEQVLVIYELPFQTESQPSLSDFGVVVHRFQGLPSLEEQPGSGLPGVRYVDQPGLYGPNQLNFNLQVNGMLASAPAEILRRILDNGDGNAPPDVDDFDPFPGGVLVPFSFQFGGKLQNVFRREAASISPEGYLQGSPMDLTALYFSPEGGTVSTEVFDDISILMAHSRVRPDVSLDTFGAPEFPFSGLGQAFDPSGFGGSVCDDGTQEQSNYVGSLQPVVNRGTEWTIESSKLRSFVGSTYRYHPWPEFDSRFEYDNDRSLLVEYRILPQETELNFENRLNFSPGTNFSEPLPRFRVFSMSFADADLDPYDSSDARNVCAVGPLDPGEYGDNARYYATFDYLKRKQVQESPWVYADRLGEGGLTGEATPIWQPAIIQPPLESLTGFFNIDIEYRATFDPEGDLPPWTSTLEGLEGSWIQFRVTLTLPGEGAEVPSISSIVIPYELPQ